MVKTSYRKFNKKEKSKVKLKGSKILPKGLNRTDTSFKVKKIVIKEQLKEHEKSELLSKKKLNVKELLSRLNHHNFGMRQEALSGLKQVVDCYPEEVFKRHLPELLEATANLAIDRENLIRKESLKLLSAILNQVSVEEMLPLFPVLSSYLVCAMTHIDLNIREDSLKLLDSLLDSAPQLVASQADLLLPRFLDLVSQKNGETRTLSLHLEGKISSEMWRARVFYRLQKLLTAIKDYNLKKDVDSEKLKQSKDTVTAKWNKNSCLFVPLYSDVYFQPCTLDIGKSCGSVSSQINQAKLKIQEYAEILIPLLLATFVEVAPYKKKDIGDAQNQHQIPVEAAVLLQCIVDIILLLWELLHQTDDKDLMINWFRKVYTNSICKRLVEQRFPYTTSQLQAKIINKKCKKQISALLSAVEGSQNIDAQCTRQNLGLSYLILLLTDANAKVRLVVINYLKNCLRSCGTLGLEQCSLLRNCLETVCATSKEPESQELLKSVIKLWDHYKLLDRPFSCMLFEFLSGIALNYKLKHLQSVEVFQMWLTELPKLLTLPKISFSTVVRISQISANNISAFSDSLDTWIETILDNVPTVTIEDCTVEESTSARRDIISLLYWVKDWDQDMVKNLGKAILNNFFGSDLTSHLIDILQLRVQNDPESSAASLIKNEDWWEDVLSSKTFTEP